MSREDLISLIIWTMKHYGSDAGDRANPGSKLQSQAEHIADVIEQYHEAERRCEGLENIQVSIMGHNLK